MSYTMIHKINTDLEFETSFEIKNAWRGAVFVWKSLAMRYLGDIYEQEYQILLNPNPLWALFDDKRLTFHEKRVLGTTFDYVVVKRDFLLTLEYSFQKFMEIYPSGNSSLSEQAEIMRNVAEDDYCHGICWTQTSVADDIWRVWVSDVEDYRDYDFTTDSKHWYLFDSLPPDKVSGTLPNAD